jgi:hypothetical protein
MTRWRRPGADEILLAYLLLSAVGFIWEWRSHPLHVRDPLQWLLFTAFLAWRVSRGGRISRMILIVVSGFSCAAAVLAVARVWDLSVLALVIIYAAQVALLTSPPVYGRTRRWGTRVHARRRRSWNLCTARKEITHRTCGVST